MSSQNENIFLKVSIAESLLNEFYKENSLFESITIFKEIMHDDHVEKNRKNILSTILSKLIEHFSKCDNRSRFLINHLIYVYKKKLSDIFIKKDIINYILAIINCSDSIARSLCLELISFLPNLILKRIDLLHTIYDLFISEKVMNEEKLIILGLFQQVIKEEDSFNVISELLLQNFDLIMKKSTCEMCRREHQNHCEECVNFKLKFIKVLKRNNLYAENLKHFFFSNIIIENFKISACLIDFIYKFDSSFFVSNRFYLVYTENTEAVLKIFLYFLNILSTDCYSENLFRFFLDYLIKNKNFIVQRELKYNYIMFPILCIIEEGTVIKTDSLTNNFESDMQSLLNLFSYDRYICLSEFCNFLKFFIQIEKFIQSSGTVYNKFCVNYQNLNLYLHNVLSHKETYSEHDINNDICSIKDKYFFIVPGNLIGVVNIIHDFIKNKPEFVMLLINFFAKRFSEVMINYDNEDIILKYFYFLDKFMILVQINCYDAAKSETDLDYAYVFLKILSNFYQLTNNKEYFIKNFIKFTNKFKIYKENNSKNFCDNNKIALFQLIGELNMNTTTHLVSLKEYFILNRTYESQIHFNSLYDCISDNYKSMLQLVFEIKNILEKKLEFESESESDNFYYILNNKLSVLSNFHVQIIENNDVSTLSPSYCLDHSLKPKLSTFSKDFISVNFKIILFLIKIIINTINTGTVSLNLDSLIHSPCAIVLNKNNKLNTIFDLKFKSLTENKYNENSRNIYDTINVLISYYSKYLLIINPPFDITISTKSSSTNISGLFKINLRIEIRNADIYKIESVNAYINLNYIVAQELEIKKKIEISKSLDSEIILHYKNPNLEPQVHIPLSINFFFTHEQFYKINFYNHTEMLLI